MIWFKVSSLRMVKSRPDDVEIIVDTDFDDEAGGPPLKYTGSPQAKRYRRLNRAGVFDPKKDLQFTEGIKPTTALSHRNGKTKRVRDTRILRETY